MSKFNFPVLLIISSAWFMLLFKLFLYVGHTMIFELELFNLSSVSFSLNVIIDKVSLSFSMVVTLISSCVCLFAYKYMEEDIFFERFMWLVMSFIFSMNLLIFSGSVFSLFIGWDGLGITSFILIVYYSSYESLSAGFQTLMANRVGDMLIVMSMVLFIFLGQCTLVPLNSSANMLVFLLVLASLTKSAQFPFSSWLPAAMAAPTPVSALVHSSTLVTAGIFLVIRLSLNMPLSEVNSSILLLVGSVTSLLGGWAATFENDLKKIIALSTLSQLGIMMFSLGLGLPYLSLFHLYMHALFKALLFIVGGTILMVSFGVQDIRLLGGVGLKMPVSIVFFTISSLCLISMPFLSAFFSKHLILEKMFMSGVNLLSISLMMISTMMTCKYVLRSLKSVVWGNQSFIGVSLPVALSIYMSMLLLGVMSIIGGKIFSILDLSNIEVVFLPNVLSLSVYVVTIMGLVMGVLIFGSRMSRILSSMFFLTPTFSMSSGLLSNLIKNLWCLDFGWIEPSFLGKANIWVISSNLNKIFLWPMDFLSVVRMVMVFFLFGFVYSFIL